jgi:hypothetical protein
LNGKSQLIVMEFEHMQKLTGPCADGANAAAEPTRARAMTDFIFEYGRVTKRLRSQRRRENKSRQYGQICWVCKGKMISKG